MCLCQRRSLGCSSCASIEAFRAYTGILPDYRVAFDSIDAILEELGEHRSMLDGILEE
ncbi:MAG: hypothetical protein ACP5GL_07730 [Infirmifilum sp.]